MKVPTVLFLLLGLLPLRAAINPENFKNVASDVVRLREIARVVSTDHETSPTRRRLTIVAEVLEVRKATNGRARLGETIVIDYTVNLTALKEAREKFAARGAMPGPQFLHEPDAPELDANKEFVAYLAPVATRLGNVNRHAGAVVDFKGANFSGPVFVPVAAQYSFEKP